MKQLNDYITILKDSINEDQIRNDIKKDINKVGYWTDRLKVIISHKGGLV